MALDLSDAMDALGTALEGIDGLRVFPYPPDNCPVPAAFVDYPETLTFDVSYQRGADEAVFRVFVLLGRSTDRIGPSRVSPYVTGATSVKAVLETDPTLGGVVQTLRVQSCKLGFTTVAGTDYLSAIFDVEVVA